MLTINQDSLLGLQVSKHHQEKIVPNIRSVTISIFRQRHLIKGPLSRLDRMKTSFDLLEPLFVIPEKTAAKCGFGDLPHKFSFNESDVILYGVPIDITTSFGKGTQRGPEALRLASAKQIETFIFEENLDISECVKIYDMGDMKFPKVHRQRQKKPENTATIFSSLGSSINRATSAIRNSNKLPVLIGGEHTTSYYSIKALAKENPVIIHFDAHRDMKSEYGGMKICHTTPFYHLIREGHIPGKNIIQIGIRQSDQSENQVAEENKVVTFDAWYVRKQINDVFEYLRTKTKNKKIYISFDIDVYDLPYVPCTGTPEPFGLNPFEIVQILKSISKSAKLIGLDLVEAGVKNNDYREGTLATQTLLRILCRDYVIQKAIQPKK